MATGLIDIKNGTHTVGMAFEFVAAILTIPAAGVSAWIYQQQRAAAKLRHDVTMSLKPADSSA